MGARSCPLVTNTITQRQIRIGLVIAFCWQLSGAVAAAQQVPSATPKSSPESSAIPLSKIASEAESTLRTVQSIETTISTDQITATVEKEQPVIHPFFARRDDGLAER